MRLVADAGLWRIGPAAAPTPLTAVLEVSGAVLSWTVDDPAGAASAQITFTDPARADWLWRILGESGHVALASALDAADTASPPHELTGVDIVPGSMDPLRRLAIGHWLRRWWPASRNDGIAGLDRALLDVEVALLTVGAQGFFTDDTLDSEVTQLLAPHAPALAAHVTSGDPRIVDLVRAGAGIADEVGIDGAGWPELHAALDDSGAARTAALAEPSGRRDDYALAAGADAGLGGKAAIARGVASVSWRAVPPGIFDAGEDTVDWIIEADETAAVAVVQAAVIGPDPATGIGVRLSSGAVGGAGVLHTGGRATLALTDARQRPMTESAAWDHDWTATSVLVGAELSGGTETRETRDRVRRWVRARLDRPGDDAFLAEILASESAY
ncbi:hypothetical protein OQ968_16260 [Mycobacterium sp. 663a-19]|uniref:hypothetical protein n=1 Tax=Mycobacterium sp. 663a-19 TaxID=2986148 RepID=UPI002D1EE685|nr:hypothetical protein [Mycobacterium sp. 663a-19]MEB3982814.1 hypothetical protein [Mycobacterium sp. 663a-19]